ncbi:monoglyceride lipase-like isoform X3 [Dysidea avara]|uniref:monoglyceride lipase-like isoform X3 n=1 Tax=Dysidea avara TaxID=196820 RepID=UPI00331C965F
MYVATRSRLNCFCGFVIAVVIIIIEATMAEGSGSFLNQDGLTIFTRNWLADRNAKAVVFISHGITEHSGRFRKLATFLQERHFNVYSHDHVGHGQSEGARIHVDNYQTYVRDVMQHLEIIKTKHPDLPLFVIGESMVTLLRIVACCLPHYEVLPENPYALSTLFEEVQERHNDPLVYHHGIKARWTMATINAQRLIQRRVPEIQIPFLTLHGTADLVVNISSSYFLMEHTKSEDKMIKVFEGSRHGIFHDKDQEQAKLVVLEWLNNHCNSTNRIV